MSKSFKLLTNGMPQFDKTPEATLDYTWDWTDWLAGTGAAIDSFSVTVESGLTVVSTSRLGAAVSAVISGGYSGRKYEAVCTITLTGMPSRVDTRTIVLNCVNR